MAPSISPTDISKHIDEIGNRIEAANVDKASCTNVVRRILYSDAELARLEVQAMTSLSPEAEKVLNDRLDSFTKQLNLRPFSKGNPLGKFFRFTSLVFSLMISGAFLALPMILLRSVDSVLHTNTSEYLKRMIAHWLLLVSGVMVTIEGLQGDDLFREACVLLTFSHASNLDGFMLSCSCPVRHYALAKKELFLVPFFSWISLAFGGVPVDRNDRTRAIRALQRSTEAATSSEGGSGMCLVIAPEGTRSKTGQLSAFKKGAFHMWEQLQAPIVPFITYGAFDLYPVGSWINNTGRVTGRYLTPIQPHEASSREEMSNLLRKRMLEALRDCPEESSTLSTAELLCHYAAINITWAISLLLSRYIARLLTVTMGLTARAAVALVVLISVFITVVLYVYYVYIVSMGGGKTDSEKTKKKQHNVSSSEKAKGE
mmetsp:Transcript_8700/g.14766  ORF Transcript_8700/g.14766 Transcript_8700/m.14766 type:complete len:429 (+) Transcript_8700:61-1347(+)